MRPNVKVILGNGALGTVAASQDGVSILAITCPADMIAAVEAAQEGASDGWVILQPKDAEAIGISEANDLANQCLVYEHIKDFYSEAPLGTELHVLLLDSAVTATNIFTEGHAAYTKLEQYLYSQSGRIRLLGLGLNPAGAEVAAADGISADLATAIPLAQAFAVKEFLLHRPIDLVLEGRKFSATAAQASDLKTLNSNSIAIMIGQDKVRAAVLSANGHANVAYAQVGKVLGRLSVIPVQRNMGRVKDGAVAGILQGALSGGALVSALSEADLDVLTDKGYIFFVKHAGKDGFFFNYDATCAPVTDDYSTISRHRTINKAARIARSVYLEELLDEVEVDPTTGKLPAIQIANFQNVLENAIRQQMAGEISGATVTVNPNQNILATNKTKALLQVVPKGTNKHIEALVQYDNPSNE